MKSPVPMPALHFHGKTCRSEKRGVLLRIGQGGRLLNHNGVASKLHYTPLRRVEDLHPRARVGALTLEKAMMMLVLVSSLGFRPTSERRRSYGRGSCGFGHDVARI